MKDPENIINLDAFIRRPFVKSKAMLAYEASRRRYERALEFSSLVKGGLTAQGLSDLIESDKEKWEHFANWQNVLPH